MEFPVPGRDQVPAIVAAHRSPPRPRPRPLPGYGYPLGVPLVPWQIITDLASRRAAPAAAYGEEDDDESA